jgi:hypothetical protein
MIKAEGYERNGGTIMKVVIILILESLAAITLRAQLPIAEKQQPTKNNAIARTFAIRNFGAACDGATDDTIAIQKTIQEAEIVVPYASSAIIDFCPAATVIVSSTLAVHNIEGWIFRGNGVVIQWKGDTASPVFEFSSTRNSVIEQFFVTPYSVAKFPIGTAIRIEETAGELVSTHNTFRNNIIEGIDKGGLNIGFELSKGTAGDNNNDEMTFIDNEIRNYTTAGFQIEHSQSVSHRMYGNVCYANMYGKYCVNQIDGNFSWFGGDVLGDTIADFNLQSADTFHPINIVGANSESSARFIETGGPTGAPWPLNIEGCRFATNRLNPDGRMIIYQAPGPFNVTGSDFGEGGRAGLVFLNPGSLAAPGWVVANITGNSFTWANSQASPILSGISQGVNLSNNVYVDSTFHASRPNRSSP